MHRGNQADHNPQQNVYVERYNRTVRYDWLAQHLFFTIQQVQEQATRFLWTYNNEGPNMALGGITPAQKLAMMNSTSDAPQKWEDYRDTDERSDGRRDQSVDGTPEDGAGHGDSAGENERR